jgi:hypothetical protein
VTYPRIRSAVARAAQRDEVAGVVERLRNQEVSPRGDVVHVEAAPVRCWRLAAYAAHLVACSRIPARLVPHAAPFEVSPAEPCVMVRPTVVACAASGGTEPPAPTGAAGVLCPASVAGPRRLVGQRRTAAFPRAAEHFARGRVEPDAALRAVRHPSQVLYVCLMAGRRAEVPRSLLRDRPGSGECVAALLARKGQRPNLRGIVARLAAVDGSTPVRFVLITALGARLDHC